MGEFELKVKKLEKELSHRIEQHGGERDVMMKQLREQVSEKENEVHRLAQKLKEANNESKVVIDQAAAERQTREIEHLKRQLTEVQVECDQLKEAEEVQSKRHKKDQDLIGDRVDQLERENEMAQKEKEIIGTGLYQYQEFSHRFHFRRFKI